MEKIKAEIKHHSHLAAKLSNEAIQAFAEHDLARGKALMKEALAASKSCQSSIANLSSIQETAEK